MPGFAGFHAGLCRPLLTQMSEFARSHPARLRLRLDWPLALKRPIPELTGDHDRGPRAPVAFAPVSDSARRGVGDRSFPVDEQEPTRCVELGLAGSRGDLQLQLFDLVLGAVPAGQGEILVPPSAR